MSVLDCTKIVTQGDFACGLYAGKYYFFVLCVHSDTSLPKLAVLHILVLYIVAPRCIVVNNLSQKAVVLSVSLCKTCANVKVLYIHLLNEC